MSQTFWKACPASGVKTNIKHGVGSVIYHLDDGQNWKNHEFYALAENPERRCPVMWWRKHSSKSTENNLAELTQFRWKRGMKFLHSDVKDSSVVKAWFRLLLPWVEQSVVRVRGQFILPGPGMSEKLAEQLHFVLRFSLCNNKMCLILIIWLKFDPFLKYPHFS